MGAAGNIPAPGGPTKTAAGQPPRPEGRAADAKKQSAVELARHRQLDALELVNAIEALAKRVVRETIKGEPRIAEAGRLVCPKEMQLTQRMRT